MEFSVEELMQIRDLPDFLRTEHCYNDLQHAMLVILFRHGLTALPKNEKKLTAKLMDNISLYLYIHFLNEEEGLAYKQGQGLMERTVLEGHSELHVDFLDYWRDEVLLPYKHETATPQDTIDTMSRFYNQIITHIDGDDIATYGIDAITVEQTRNELARIAKTNMPMSPFMAGAYQAVKVMDRRVAETLDQSLLSPYALEPLRELNLVQNVGRVLKGTQGSLRDRFAEHTRGDQSALGSETRIYS